MGRSTLTIEDWPLEEISRGEQTQFELFDDVPDDSREARIERVCGVVTPPHKNPTGNTRDCRGFPLTANTAF